MPQTTTARRRRRKTPRRKENIRPSQVVADQVKALRGYMSQQQLAEKIDESQSTVARIESGDRSITIEELFKIALALDVAPVHLLGAGFVGDSVPIAGKVRVKPSEARAWIRGKHPINRPGADFRKFLFENIPDDEAEELFTAKRTRDWLEGFRSFVELAIAGRVEAVDFDPHAKKAEIDALLEKIDAQDADDA
jgi:transcriptional regulator with XRE-family HTH domain